MVTETEWTRRYRHTGKCWWVCVKGDMKMFVYLQAVASQQSTLLAWRVANPVVRHMLSLVLKCITRRHFSCFLISLCPGISRVSLQVLCYESCIHWLIVRLPAAARLILERFFTWKCALHHLRLSRPWLSMEVSVLPDHMCTLSHCGVAALNDTAVMNKSSQSYGTSLAIWDHTYYLPPDTSECTPPNSC